jgi:hypothetical protein
LALQFFVQLTFELANFPAAHAGHVDVVTRAVALVEMTIATEMEKVQLVNQAVTFQKIECAIHGDARDSGIHFLGTLENFARVQVAARGLHYLKQNASLAREPNAARSELALKTAGCFVIYAFAGGDTMCGSAGHWINRHYTKIAQEEMGDEIDPRRLRDSLPLR